MSAAPEGYLLTADNINQCTKRIRYVGQGKLVVKSNEIDKALKQGEKYPFSEQIKASIGDCQAMGQRPITFIREVLALVIYPPLFEDPRFASDVKEKARTILGGCEGGSIGAYTNKQGIDIIRQHAAEYITKRDGGIPSNYKDIILSAGSAEAIRAVLRLLDHTVDGKKTGVLGPIPQYPLYSATSAELHIVHVGYYLDEDNAWGLNMSELQRVVDDARQICNPRVLVITNPGNPAGQVLSRKNIEEVIRFAHKERLFILADEVYQGNVYDKDSEFHSFKRVLFEMGAPYNRMELATFMSCSKGYMSECGLRGGYVEMVNLHPEVDALWKNLLTIVSCPSVVGQATLDCIVKPPQPGDPSYELYSREKKAILDSLAERAKITADAFNQMEGVTCNIVQGAMYAFPKIDIPARAVAEAEAEGEAPDSFYAVKLLEETGVCVLPGSGFGQKPGTYHIRATILPQPEDLKTMMVKMAEFHKKFMNEYK